MKQGVRSVYIQEEALPIKQGVSSVYIHAELLPIKQGVSSVYIQAELLPIKVQLEGGEFTWVPGGLWLFPYWIAGFSAGHRRNITWIRSLVNAAFSGDLRDVEPLESPLE